MRACGKCGAPQQYAVHYACILCVLCALYVQNIGILLNLLLMRTVHATLTPKPYTAAARSNKLLINFKEQNLYHDGNMITIDNIGVEGAVMQVWLMYNTVVLLPGKEMHKIPISASLLLSKHARRLQLHHLAKHCLVDWIVFS